MSRSQLRSGLSFVARSCHMHHIIEGPVRIREPYGCGLGQHRRTDERCSAERTRTASFGCSDRSLPRITNGMIYEKDLGEKTVELAQGITEYNPGEGWEPANQQ
jgi:hypothetical protein